MSGAKHTRKNRGRNTARILKHTEQLVLPGFEQGQLPLRFDATKKTPVYGGLTLRGKGSICIPKRRE